jgi:hypothetical protein
MTPPDNHTYDFTSHPLEEIIDMDDKMAGRSVERELDCVVNSLSESINIKINMLLIYVRLQSNRFGEDHRQMTMPSAVRRWARHLESSKIARHPI